ncbi:hypothetical protein VKT23_003008 [Stygiomarasmius scandens]|uniref:Uncharacterized protein n=1 Tax=Marasmiellus scandens TaxID=2682957 RepID=A0ABR1JYA1_9AGAR
MASQPPLQRKASTGSKKEQDAAVKAEKDSQAMPPPPVPASASQIGILEPEMRALAGCLRNATVKTAQVLNFYADARKLGIEKHASTPPHRLQAALGREIEKYDQLCDSIEAHLLRAIAVLQRDADREEQRRIKEAEAAAAAAAKEAEANTSNAEASSQAGSIASDKISQTAIPFGRRPSAISISSLHRPTPPLKIDLSATSLRMSAEEAILSGVPSPVRLAPQSARPIEDYDLMAAFASSSSDSNPMNLSLPDHTASDAMNIDLNTTLGSSADKPIELDMDGVDINDLFGDEASTSADPNNVVEELFSPAVGPGESSEAKDSNFLSALGVDGATNSDLFASLGARETDPQSGGLNVPSSETQNAPSPNTLLASFSAHQVEGPSSSSNAAGSSFDLTNLDDLNFFAGDQDSEMQNLDLWNIDTSSMDVSGDGNKPS